MNRFIALAMTGYVLFASLWILFSDQLLVTIGDPAEIAWLSSLKGLVFVVVTAIGLVAGLRYVASRAVAEPARLAGVYGGRPRGLLVTLAVIAALLGGIGSLVYRSGSEALTRQKLDELTGVAQLKVDAVSRWLGERRANLTAFAYDPVVSGAINDWLIRNDPDGRTKVSGALASLRKAYGFASATLLLPDGRVLLADGQPTLDGARLSKAIAQVMLGGDVVLIDFYPPGNGEAPRIGLMASVTVPRRGANLGRTLIAVELNPADFLYPLLQSWPTDEPSGQAALVRREWGDVVYLSDLRLAPGSALKTRIPLGQATLPIAKLLLGEESQATGIDLRGVPVLVAGRPVAGTDWFLLTQMDQADAFRQARRLAILTSGILGATMLFAAAIGVLTWQRQRLQGALLEMRQRAETAAAELRFHATFDQATNGLAHLDLEGRWLRVNPRLLILTGLSREALLASDPRTIVCVDDQTRFDACVERLRGGQVQTCSGERHYRRPDGSEPWLALSLTLVHSDEGSPQFFVLSVEDVTERKATELALRERVNLHEYLERIAATVPGLIYSFRLAPDGRVSMPYGAPGLSEVFYGITPTEAAADAAPIMARIDPKDAEQVWASIGKSAADLTMWTGEFRVHHPVRGELWIQSRAMPEREADGGTIWHGFLRDTTEEKQAEIRVRQAAAVFSNTQEGVVITDLQSRIIRVNPSVCAITGYSEAELLGHTMRVLQSGRHDRAFYEALWQSVQTAGYWQGEIWNRRKNGDVYPELLTISTVRDAGGRPTNYVGTFTDITNLKQSEKQLERLAHHDALTGLPNRLLLLSRLEHAVERVERHGGLGAVLFLDLDRFKNVNDSLGHPAGDELLIAVARRMRARLRDSDTLARLGGDEFIIVLEDVGSSQQAASVAQELIDRVSESFELSGANEVYIGASIGISMFPSDSIAANELIQHADAALYVAKEAGKRTYRFYRTELTEAANNRLALEARLRRGLERGEMVLHYQPLVTIEDQRTVGVEALLRWNDPREGLIYPDRFIPLAEETGIIVPLGEWVLREACRQFQAWRQSGIALDTIAVNLSPRQFQQHDIGLKIRGILTETGLSPRCLELEITESALMHQGEETLAKLANLKELGIRLAIDDFGTGYSSLAYLKRFPIDKLKIDKSFVRDVPNDLADCEISAAIIALAKNLKLEVLAEGVETQPQLAFLKSHGCDTAQGYLFARPMPAMELEAMLSAVGTAGRKQAGGKS